MAGPGERSAKLGKMVVIPYNSLEPELCRGALEVTEVTETQRGCGSLKVTQVKGRGQGARAIRTPVSNSLLCRGHASAVGHPLTGRREQGLGS